MQRAGSTSTAATPALAAKDSPDSHWLSVFESRGQQATRSTYNPSVAIQALAAKDCPASHWLLVYESCGQQAKETNADSMS